MVALDCLIKLIFSIQSDRSPIQVLHAYCIYV